MRFRTFSSFNRISRWMCCINSKMKKVLRIVLKFILGLVLFVVFFYLFFLAMGTITVLLLGIGVKRFLIICGVGFILLAIKVAKLIKLRE